jgi:hypothetical protein
MIRALKRELTLVKGYYNQRKFRKMILPHVSDLIDSEKSSVHWKYLNVTGKIVLDLGCGLWDVNDMQECSPVYFKNKGAKKIIGADLNAGDINILKEYFDEHFKGDGSEFLVKAITTASDMLELIAKYQIQSIKCDIEGFEKVMFNIDKSLINNITDISVEYHTNILFLNLVNTFNNWGFTIINHSVFTYAPQGMGVITATRK